MAMSISATAPRPFHFSLRERDCFNSLPTSCCICGQQLREGTRSSDKKLPSHLRSHTPAKANAMQLLNPVSVQTEFIMQI